jgi:hypothetical protein
MKDQVLSPAATNKAPAAKAGETALTEVELSTLQTITGGYWKDGGCTAPPEKSTKGDGDKGGKLEV